MRIPNAVQMAGAAWMISVVVVSAREIHCVVCGEATQGGQAVILGDQAYPVHEFGCLPTWQRAESQGLLRDLDHPLTPGDPVFQTPGLAASDPSERVARGSVRVWAAFLVGACLMSGSLAALFGILTHRPKGRAFLLGFFLPAVGMVLVPVLPERTRQETEQNVKKGETS